MRRKIFKVLGYSFFFLLCLVFFFVKGFPAQVVGEQLTREIGQRSGLKLTYQSLDTLFPNGVEAQGVRLLKEGKENEAPLSFRLDQVSARISLFSLLTGKKNLSFSSELLNGKLSGRLGLEPSQWWLDAQLAGIRLGKLNFWTDLMGQELSGQLSGSVNLKVNTKDVKTSTGNILLQLTEGQVGNGKVYGVKLPPIDLGKTRATINIQKGKAEIKEFMVQSDDIEANVDGYFLLQQNMQHMSAHCKLRYKPSDDTLAAVRKQIPTELRGLMDNELNRAKGKDGYYRYSIFGRLFGGKPQFRPLKQ